MIDWRAGIFPRELYVLEESGFSCKNFVRMDDPGRRLRLFPFYTGETKAWNKQRLP
jgi:hypothetical protein